MTLAELIAELNAFGDKAAGLDWAVVYYAGHGIEIGGVNYLIPVDAELPPPPMSTTRPFRSTACSQGGGRAEASPRHPRRLPREPLHRQDGQRGRHPLRRPRAWRASSPKAACSSPIRRKDGQVAQDGDGANSPFAQALLAHLDEPGLEINMLFRQVRDDVKSTTGGAGALHLWLASGRSALFQGCGQGSRSCRLRAQEEGNQGLWPKANKGKSWRGRELLHLSAASREGE